MKKLDDRTLVRRHLQGQILLLDTEDDEIDWLCWRLMFTATAEYDEEKLRRFSRL
jgi:hypothetical protein